MSNFAIRALYEAPSEPGILWIGTERGLNRYDRATGHVTTYRHDPGDVRSLSSDTVQVVLEDLAGRLWVGTERGLNRMDRATGRFTRYAKNPREANSLIGDDVQSLATTPDGALWIGTANGLDRLDPVTETFTHYTATTDTSYHPSLYRRVQTLAAQRPPVAALLRPSPAYSEQTAPFTFDEQTDVFVLAKGTFGNLSRLAYDHGWIEDEDGNVARQMNAILSPIIRR